MENEEEGMEVAGSDSDSPSSVHNSDAEEQVNEQINDGPSNVVVAAIEDEDSHTLSDAAEVEDNQPSAGVSPKKRPALDVSMDDDNQCCPICFDAWTSSNEHRLVSLRCGHLFGKSCIKKWLKGQGNRCPQCNAPAKKTDIRAIYARCLKVVDNTELDSLAKKYENEMELRKKAELECAQLRMKLGFKAQECENLKTALMSTQNLLNESRSNSVKLSNLAVKAPESSFVLAACIELNQGCRVMDCNDLLGIMVISQQSANPLFKGFGLRKISLSEAKKCEFIYLHQKPIKDVSFHKTDGLVLTASLDKTIKITNCLNDSMVQSYQLDSEAWSCLWDQDDPRYFYAGLRTGAINIFDIRMTSGYVDQLWKPSLMAPVVSMEYVSRNGSIGKSGLIVGHLSSCSFYDKKSSNQFEISQLPIEGSLTSLSYELSTSLLLASCRPSMKHSHVTHTLCELAHQEESVQCNLVHLLNGGKVQAQLTRSRLIPHPDCDSSVLVCAGDEESTSCLLWNGSTGDRMASLKSNAPILDIATFHKEHNVQLATLTEKCLRVYNWS